MQLSSRLRPAFLLLLTYATLSALPLLPLLLGRTLHQPLRIAGVEFVAWVVTWAAFQRPAWFHWMLLPSFLALPVEIYLQVYYNQGISPHHLGIIAETTPAEALEFLGHRLVLLLVIMTGMVAWWGWTWKIALRGRILVLSGSWRVAMLGIITLLGAAWIYGLQLGIPSSSARPSGHKSPLWASAMFDEESFASSWPFGLFARGWEFWKERTYLAELADKSRKFTFNARQVGTNDLPQIVVMVIGESSRFDRWGINGCKRETTPLLKKEVNLVSLSDVVTAVSATRLSVPVLVSRKPATQSLKAGFSEKSFLSAFKEAGFKTYWLSNQMSFGQFDTPISVFAEEADVTRFMNLGGFRNDSSFDSILLEPLRKAIDDPAPKKLIVLHSLGSHWNYSHRYPQEFDKWQPSLFGMADPAYTESALKLPLNNSYDNSILYTDWFLGQVIAELKASKGIASMMYVADHGETLYDGTCKLALHGHNTQYDFHIPALMWYSDMYRTTHPMQVLQLHKNQHAKLTTENMFHSLLDMANIRYDKEQLEWSFLNPKFKTHKRYVDSYGWADYDNSTFKGDCREVIDKNQPLSRSD